jgi:Peptidase family C25/Secretion system C-terminal sorting domain
VLRYIASVKRLKLYSSEEIVAMARVTVLFFSLMLLVGSAFALNETPAKASIRPYEVISDAYGITLEFEELDLSWESMIDGGEMPILSGAGEVGVAGGPRLPVYSELLAVPDGMKLVLRNVHVRWRDLGVRELAHDTGQENETTRDEMLFNRIAVESQETVVVGTTGRWRDLRIATVSVRPMKVVAGTGHVLIAEDLEIELGYESIGGYDDTFDPPGISEAMLPLYEEYVGNALDYINYEEVVRGTYLMIYPDNWLTEVERLAEWRTKTGFNVLTASTSVTGNSFNSIYTYIRGVYESADPALEYVCLVGDIDDYPNIDCEYVDPGVPFPYDPDIGTDQKYTYDVNGGSSFEDVLPRYLIGRISVDTETELRTMVNKIIQYEQTPLEGNPERWLRAVTVANASTAISTALTQDWVKSKMVTNGFTNVQQYVFDWGNNISAQTIANAINDNVSWVTYRGFGSHTYWAGPYFYNSDVDGRIFNTDNVPVITSMVCGGGAFDELDDDPCFGEKWIRHGTPTDLKGAVAFIAPSEIDTHTRWNNMVLGGWYTAMFDQGLRTLGQCMLSSKIQLYNNYPFLWNAFGNNESSVWFYFHSYNILGDPALQLRTEIPKILEVDHPAELLENDTHAEILVLDEFGLPIENAMVVITRNGTDIIGQARSHSNGVADIILFEAPDDESVIELTVTRPDVEPYLYTFNNGGMGIVNMMGLAGVEDGSDPDTNDDGYLNPGELINPNAAFQVAEEGGLDEVLVSISVPSEHATIVTPFQNFGSQGQGNTFQTEDLRVRVRPTVANDVRIPVTFMVNSDGGNQTHVANLPRVMAPQLQLSAIEFQADWYPGDQSAVDIVLDNLEELVGTSSVSGYLTIDDNSVSVVDPNGTWPALNGGATSVHMNDYFQLEVAPGAYPGHVAQGTVELTTARGFEQSIAVEFVAMGASPTTPTGPTGPGYYIFEDVDSGYDYTPDMTWESIYGNGGWDIGIDDTGNNEDDIVTIDLPFDFPYWDQTYSNISVCSNGWMSFGESEFYFFRNRPIPGSLTPNAGIMALWDDLVVDWNNSGVFAYHDVENGWFTIEWYRVFHYNSQVESRRIDFQIRLFDPAVHGAPGDLGMIGILYHSVENRDVGENYLTMGINSPDGREGLQYEFANINAPTSSGLEDDRQLLIVSANHLEPAHITYTPPVLQMNAESGQTAGGELIITNDGGRAATVDIWPEGIDQSWGLSEFDEFGEADGRGYRWYDSREDFGPEYTWVDNAQPGNEIVLNDGDEDGYGSISTEVALPWDFPFYEEQYSSLWISESGYVTFTEPVTGYGESSNTSLPRPYAPKPAIFPYWDNVGTDEGGAVYASTVGNYFIVTWEDIHQLSWATDDGPYTFQVILSRDGAIHTQYFEMDGDVDSATIGTNDEAGSNGLLTAYNSGVPAFMMDELSVRFSPGLPWLTVSPVSHSIGPGETISVQLTGNSEGLSAGVNSGRMLLLSHLSGESYALPIDFLVTDDVLGYSPSVGNLPGESIAPDGNFQTISLDPYVEDWDHSDAQLDWIVYGTNSLDIDVDENHVASITAPPGWVGPETVSFRVNDPMLNYESVSVTFDTEDNNDAPRFDTALPDALGEVGTGTEITFSVTVSDPEDGDADLEWYHDAALIGTGSSVTILFEDILEMTTVRVLASDTQGATSELTWQGIVFDSGVDGGEELPLPASYALESVYPNPFNANVVLSYALPRTSDVELVVYNLLGQEVIRQMQFATPAGRHEIVLDATRWASGLYFMDWRAGDVRQIRKAVLLK